MQSQVKKLAVICNACFWLTIFFKYWKNARNIYPDVLNTVIILGITAIVANIAWLVIFLAQRKKTVVEVGSAPMNKGWVEIGFNLFNFFSLVAQIIYMVLNFL